MNEHEKDTVFLRQCILYDDSLERRQLDEQITRAQRDERCVRRAVWLMSLLTALSAAGLAFGAVLQENFPYGKPRFVINLLCEIGLASLISLLAFVCLFLVYRKELNRLRKECRRLATKLLESRLGQPRALPLPGVVKAQEFIAEHSKAIVSVSEMVTLPRGLRSH